MSLSEVGCNNESSAALFRAISYYYDGSRGTTQNRKGEGDHPLSAQSLDVQGFSHKKDKDFEKFHKDNPEKPMMATECCSCLSQRGEDYDTCDKPRPSDCKDGDYRGRPGPKSANLTCHHDCASGPGKSYSDAFHTSGRFYNNGACQLTSMVSRLLLTHGAGCAEISQCTAKQVYMSDSREYVAGTFVWSGFDYFGESRGYPQTVKCRGVVADIAGFLKETHAWMRLWWYSKIDEADAGRPALQVPNSHTCFIVESWRTGAKADGHPIGPNRTVHVCEYSKGLSPRCPSDADRCCQQTRTRLRSSSSSTGSRLSRPSRRRSSAMRSSRYLSSVAT